MDRITQNNHAPRWLVLLCLGILAALVAAAFWPVFGFDFVSADTSDQVLDNVHIRALTQENLWHIFTSRCTFSYYPIRTLTYAFDYLVWGYRAGGFKLTNVLIHLSNVYLTYWLLLRLLHKTDDRRPINTHWKAVVAAMAAALLAIHPVVVEPVVWIPGREELLMTLGALGCMHFHLNGRAAAGQGQPASRVLLWHSAAVAAMAAACLSNAVAAVIPLLITAWDLLTLRPRNLRAMVGGTAALWLLGAATIVIKRLCEVEHNVAYAQVFSADWALMILNMYWLNLKTLVWPSGLVIYYDWPNPAGFLSPQVLLGVFAAATTAAVLWVVRRRVLLVFGLSWFLLALAPTSQIIPHHIARADRFLYLPLVGLTIALVAVLGELVKRCRGLRAQLEYQAPSDSRGTHLGRQAQPDLPAAHSGRQAQSDLPGTHRGWHACLAGGMAVAAVALAILATLTAGQVSVWRDDMSVWSHCAQIEPQNAYAHSRVGKQLARAGLFEQAVQRYTLAIGLRPDHADTLAELAVLFATWSDPEQREYELAIELAEEASERTGGNASRIQRKLAVVRTSHAEHLAARAEFAEAIQEYRRAIHADPNFDLPRFNLALLLTTCPDRSLRRPDEAIRHATRGCEFVDPVNAHRQAILAAAYAEAGRFGEAVSMIRQAIQAAQRERDPGMEEELYVMLNLYRRGRTVESADGP
jgi:tetratricopeptide (TPR) repeat protein